MTAFTDGVVAIIITIMVLELKLPHGAHLADLGPVLPLFLSYLLSFIYIGIYWNNHHHMLHLAGSVSGPILWANLHLLFWLSLIPFVTAWMGENGLTALPVALYGGVLMMAAVAYRLLTSLIVRHEGRDSALGKAMGRDRKGKVSLALYAGGVGLAFVQPLLSVAIYLLIPLVYFMPGRTIERLATERTPAAG